MLIWVLEVRTGRGFCQVIFFIDTQRKIYLKIIIIELSITNSKWFAVAALFFHKHIKSKYLSSSMIEYLR